MSSTHITLLSRECVFVHVAFENITIGMPQPYCRFRCNLSLLATRLGHPMVILSKAHMNERMLLHNVVWGVDILVDQIQARGNLFVDITMDCGLLSKFVASDPVALDCLHASELRRRILKFFAIPNLPSKPALIITSIINLHSWPSLSLSLSLWTLLLPFEWPFIATT